MYKHQQKGKSNNQKKQKVSIASIQKKNKNAEFQKELQLKESIQQRQKKEFVLSDVMQRVENTEKGSKDLTSTYRDTYGYSKLFRFESSKLKGAKLVLEKIRTDFGLGSANEYELHVVSNFSAVLPKGEKVPKGGGQAFTKDGFAVNEKIAKIYFGLGVVADWLASNKVGNLISTLRHEYTHVRQRNSEGFREKVGYNNLDVAEFDAYYQEVADAATNHVDGASPDTDHLWESVMRANRHGTPIANRYHGFKDWGDLEQIRPRYELILRISERLFDDRDIWGIVMDEFGINTNESVEEEDYGDSEERVPLLSDYDPV